MLFRTARPRALKLMSARDARGPEDMSQSIVRTFT
jgi:hypothetical protein